MKIDAKKFNIYQARECLENMELKQKSGVSMAIIRKIKSDKDIEFRPKTVGLIAKALNVEIQEIIKD